MQPTFLNINMEVYLRFAPYSIFILWIYILFQNFKSLQKVKKASNRSYKWFLNPFSLSGVLEEARNNRELEIAYQNHKRKSRKLFILWGVSLIIFMVISILVGILFAYFK
jgi:hypothetical protein